MLQHDPSAGTALDCFPVMSNGFSARIEDSFHMLPEAMETYREWKKLVALHAVSGLKVYDVGLVPSAIVYGIEALLTFKDDDFRRCPGIRLLHPRDLA
jgi:predicted nucleic acid-binding protein